MRFRPLVVAATFCFALLPSATAEADDVFLRNGGLYRGELKEIVPGQYVIISVEAGEPKRIAWNEIDRIVAGELGSTTPTTPTPPTTPPPPPTPTEPEPPPAPRTEWRANRPLLVTGAIMFGAGYAPNVGVALPSTLGLVGRVLLYVFSLGIVPLACALGGGNGDYICTGQHGAMQLLVPVAGPFLFVGDHPRDSVVNERGRPLSDTTKGLLWASGGLQIAGISSILLAVALGKQEPVPTRRASTAPSFFVTPSADGATMGLTLGVRRW